MDRDNYFISIHLILKITLIIKELLQNTQKYKVKRNKIFCNFIK
jgi:two-component sensor histidine kinase